LPVAESGGDPHDSVLDREEGVQYHRIEAGAAQPPGGAPRTGHDAIGHVQPGPGRGVARRAGAGDADGAGNALHTMRISQPSSAWREARHHGYAGSATCAWSRPARLAVYRAVSASATALVKSSPDGHAATPMLA